MGITLQLDTRYHERKKEKGSNKEKTPPVIGSNSFRPCKDSSSKKNHHKNSKKGKNIQVSKDKLNSSILNKKNNSIGSEKEKRIKEVSFTYCDGKHPIEKLFKGPHNRPGLSRGFPSRKGKS
ncbi:hypothetical protein O181_007766 [Austropuccinia psidii MF-1]|uniref:Uncharacterized protein n=1 Tax=Austropuccinia psidii MF-1 TaxID=1389203 RepID=A0A9Q3BNI8_9BASI|nr:hypothetical protein [Austropuccinia psidii MF-1]